MTAQGSGRSCYRPLAWATRALLFAGLLIVAAPLWLAWVLIVAILALARPFVTVPLGLASVGGVAIALYFGQQAQWADALQAGFMALLSSLALVGFTALGERIDPGFGQSRPLPPWWWCF